MDLQTEKSSPLICKQRVNGQYTKSFSFAVAVKYLLHSMAGTVGTLVTTILEHHVEDFVFMISTQRLMDSLLRTDGDAYEPSDDRLSNSSG